MQNKFGIKSKLESSIDVADCYKDISNKNYRAATILFDNGLYNEASYLFIQSMEKEVKYKICNIIDSTNPYFGKGLIKIGHSLEKSIDFLIKILCKGNVMLEDQMKNQIVFGIIKKYSI